MYIYILSLKVCNKVVLNLFCFLKKQIVLKIEKNYVKNF